MIRLTIATFCFLILGSFYFVTAQKHEETAKLPDSMQSVLTKLSTTRADVESLKNVKLINSKESELIGGCLLNEKRMFINVDSSLVKDGNLKPEQIRNMFLHTGLQCDMKLSAGIDY